MLSLLPGLLAFEQFAPFLLRLTIGIILIHWAYRTWKSKKSNKDIVLSVFLSITGLLYVIGLFVQLASILSMVYLGVKLFGKIKQKAFLTDGVNYYFILFIISLSLIVTGAGAFAFDLAL
jgi:chromate transport protein ChrA